MEYGATPTKWIAMWCEHRKLEKNLADSFAAGVWREGDDWLIANPDTGQVIRGTVQDWHRRYALANEMQRILDTKGGIA